MDFKKAATEIADALVTVTGVPLTTRDDGIKYVETYLREVWRQAAERGRRDYHNQLADNMYPRNRD